MVQAQDLRPERPEGDQGGKDPLAEGDTVGLQDLGHRFGLDQIVERKVRSVPQFLNLAGNPNGAYSGASRASLW
jgi:hypothetical protein